MAKLTAVDFDPFDEKKTAPSLTPVDFDPFSDAPRADFSGVSSRVIPAAPEGFLDRTGDYLRQQQAKPLAQRLQETPGQILGGVESFGRGLASGFNNLGGSAALIGAMPVAAGIDLLTGHAPGTGPAGEAVGRYVDSSYANAQRLLAEDPRRDNPLTIIPQAAGAVIPDLAAAMATGGESAAVRPAIQTGLRDAVLASAERAVDQGVRASIIPSVNRGTQLGQQVIQAGGTPAEAMAALGSGAAANSLAFLAPAATSGSLPARLAQGALVEPAAGYLQTQLENLALPDRLGLDQQYDAQQAITDAFMGAGLGGMTGERAPEPLNDPVAMRGAPAPVSDLSPSARAVGGFDEARLTPVERAPEFVDEPAPRAAVTAPAPEARETARPSPAPDVRESVAPDSGAATLAREEVLSEPATDTRVALEPQAPQETREVVAKTPRGEFRLEDRPAVAGRDFSEFGQIREVTAYDGDTPIGTLVYANDGTPPTVEVNPEYQRRGVATAMLKLAREQGGVLGAADTGMSGRGRPTYRTDEGQAFRSAADESSVQFFAPEQQASPAAPATPQAEEALAPVSQPIPMPAAPPAAEAPPPAPRESTGIKHAVTDMERAREGRDPISRELRQSNEQTYGEAMQRRTEDPTWTASLIERHKTSTTPGTLTATEQMALLQDKVALRQERDAAATRVGNDRLPESERAAAKAAWLRAEQAINDIDVVTSEAGSNIGRALQIRQRMLRDDFSLEAMERRERAVRGRPLTQAEHAQLVQLSERIKGLERDLEAARKAVEDHDATRGVKQAYESILKEVVGQSRTAARAGKPKLDVMRERAEKSRAEIRKSLGQFNSGVDPALFGHLVNIGAYHVADGAVRLKDWMTRMKAELGDVFERVRDILPDVFAASRMSDRAAETQFKADARTGEALTPTDIAAEVDPENVTTANVRDLALAHIRSGLRGEDAVMKAVHGDLEDAGAGLTEREVRQLFSEYGRQRNPTRDADRAELGRLRQLVKLQESIDRLTTGQKPLTGARRGQVAEEVRQKRAQLNQMLKQAGLNPAASPERQAALRQKRIENLNARIADLQDQIATGRRPAGRQRAASGDAEIQALRNRINDLTAERNAVDAEARRAARDPEAIYQGQRGRAIEREIEKIQARIKADDYAHAPRMPRQLSEANQRAAYELDKARQEFRNRQFMADLANRSGWAKALDNTKSGVNLARAIQTGLDLSGLLRQGGVVTFSHPIRAGSAIPDMLRSFISERKAHAIEQDLKARPNAPLYRKAGLDITESHGEMSKMEEQYMTRWLDRLNYQPGQPVRNAARRTVNIALGPIRGSGRAYGTVLNKLRADTFDAMVATLSRDGQAPTMDEAKAIANYVNVATGRGNPGRMKQFASDLNTVFFAPRLVLSRFQFLTGQPLYGGTARTRALVAQEYARYLTGMSLVYGLGYLWHHAQDEDKDEERPFIETDPRSTMFGRMRFGDTYLDPLSGLGGITTFLSRLATGETKSSGGGDINPLRDQGRLTNALYGAGQALDRAGFNELAARFPDAPNYDRLKYGDPTEQDTMASFLRSKLAPVPGAVVSSVVGKDPTGQSTDPGQQAAGLIAPMSLGNIADVMRANGTGTGLALNALQLLGMGTTVTDRATYKAPDYATLGPQQRAEYNDYLKRAQRMKSQLDDLRDLANSFPADTPAADVREAVEAKAQALGIDGVGVEQYKRRTTARDASGARRSGLQQTESGKVKLKIAKDSVVGELQKTEDTISDLNKQITSLMDAPITNGDLQAIYSKYQSGSLGGDAGEEAPTSAKMKVIQALANERGRLIQAFMSSDNEE